MRLKHIALGAAVLAASFYASLKAMDHLWPRAVQKPALAQLPPLPPVTSKSKIVAPVAIALSTIGTALDRAAPRDFGGKADNPVRQILSNADINWTVSRGPFVTGAAQNALTVSTPLEGKLTVLGSLNTAAGSQINNVIGNLLGGDAAKRIGNISIKSINANAAIRGAAAMTARPQIMPNWRIDPGLTAQVNLGDTSLTVAGARVAVPAQVKPMLDRTVNEQIERLQQRLRNDATLEQRARREWDKLCRSIALPPAAEGLPPLYLEMRPVNAFAAQPRIDARNVTLLLGLQAETRIVAAQTKPQCPFPATLNIVPPSDGRINIAVPIDLSFDEVSRIVQSQLKDRSFPDNGEGPVSVTVKSAAVDAAGDRLLISLLVNAREKKSFFGFGTDATVRIWGRPMLDRQQQILKLTDLDLAVESDAGFGLVGAAAQMAAPYLKDALAQNAAIDLKTLAANAQQKLAGLITDMRANDDGLRIEAAVTDLRLGDIAFDSKTLRVLAEVSGSINVDVTALPR